MKKEKEIIEENTNGEKNKYLDRQNVKAFYEFDTFEFMQPDENGLGLSENNIVVAEKEMLDKDGKTITVFEFFKDGQSKDSKPDNTILPDKFSEYKKEEAENSSVTSVINGVEDDEDFENVKIKRPSILPQTGEASSMIKCGVFVIIGMILITFAAYFIYRKF